MGEPGMGTGRAAALAGPADSGIGAETSADVFGSRRPVCPPPRLRVRPGVWLGNGAERLRLRAYCNTDGDYTNALINAGVKLETECSYWLDIGLDLVIPPRLFWLLKLLGVPE
jgi:hypothetical protein